MNSEDILRMARKAGFAIDSLWMTYPSLALPVLLEHFAALVAAAEREVIMDSLQKQAELATDALDRRWALEMIAAVAARSSK